MIRARRLVVIWLLLCGLSNAFGAVPLRGQDPGDTEGPQPANVSDAAGANSGSADPQDGNAGNAGGSAAARSKSINVLSLLVLGGWFMVPLTALSLAVVALSIERGVALRTQRLLPDRLVADLGQLSQQAGGLDPKQAYRLCQKYPSAAADVLRNVLVKVGRPHAELERAVSETSQRSAIRLQQPVSWLTLIAAIAPLIGLLGTVWGITQAFYDTTQLEVGQNRAEALSAGIYVALVTTIVGLMIAIPATIVSHFFENRIIRGLNQIEEMVSQLLPQLERYEGQVRFTSIESSGTSSERPAATTGESANGQTSQIHNNHNAGGRTRPAESVARHGEGKRDSAWSDWDIAKPSREPRPKG